MPTREYYLRQAQVLFDLAAKMSLKADAERLIARAKEYQILADAMPPDDEVPRDGLPIPATSPSAIVQPMQQEQQHEGGDIEGQSLEGFRLTSLCGTRKSSQNRINASWINPSSRASLRQRAKR